MRVNLGIPMRLSEIARATGGVMLSKENPMVKAVSTDSRQLRSGDLFIALPGRRRSGLEFVGEARKKGCLVLSEADEQSHILHPDGGAALLSFAKKYKKTLPYILYRIGITGSVGKTTTKELLRAILKTKYKVHASEGNFNSEIGMPMSILSAEKECEILIMEMGMNHPGEIKKMSYCLAPSIALITNVGTAHIGNLGSREEIAKAKLEITEGMNGGDIFVPSDEPLLEGIANRSTFGYDVKRDDFSIAFSPQGSISIYNKGKLYASNIAPPFFEEHNLKCLLAAVSVAIKIGLTPEEIHLGISSISVENTRQKQFLRENYLFYTDFYNASRESVLACIKSAESITHTKDKSLLLGDILELGDMSEKIHYEVGRAISPQVFNRLFLFGNLVRDVGRGAIESGFPAERIFTVSDLSRPELCAELIRRECKTGEMIFMKASRAVGLERVLDCFKDQGEKH